MSKLEQLMAQREGFGIPGALPTRNNNPGDLRHAPGEMHDPGKPDSVGSFANPRAGWGALERQIALEASRDLTLEQMVAIYAPESDGNDTAGYLNFLCDGLGCAPDTLVSDALKIT
jgi:hypothetical protein